MYPVNVVDMILPFHNIFMLFTLPKTAAEKCDFKVLQLILDLFSDVICHKLCEIDFMCRTSSDKLCERATIKMLFGL